MLINEGEIQEIGLGLAGGSEVEVLDVSSFTLVPGFIDVHTHGAMGYDFNRATKDGLHQISDYFSSCGVTSYFPTILPDVYENILNKLDFLSREDVLAENPTIKGIHLEGPFINPSFKGAMPAHLLLGCDLSLFHQLYEASRQTIRLLTISPELPGALQLIEEATKLGLKVSVGHSGASYEQTIQAIKAGAVSSTHTMNAMKKLDAHDPGILAAIFESDLFGEMICDGLHLPPEIIRMLLKIKGYDRMVGVTDSLTSTGLPDGLYMLGVNQIRVQGGDALLVQNGIRAGSTLTMDKALRNLHSFTGKTLHDLSPLVSGNAAKLVGLEGKTGEIAVGMRADMVALDEAWSVRLTIAGGNLVFRR